jgi:hypothetical protein
MPEDELGPDQGALARAVVKFDVLAAAILDQERVGDGLQDRPPAGFAGPCWASANRRAVMLRRA